MLPKFLKKDEVLYFLGGLAVSVVGSKVLKSDKTRKVCVKGLAKGMQIQENAKVSFQNMKEEAADICYDAKNEAEATKELV